MTATLKGQVAAISGGLGDIGLAIARELATRGADVGLGDVKPASACASQLDELKRLGTRVGCYEVDVGDPGSVEDWLDAIVGDLGVPTLVVSNAAIVTLGKLTTITPEDWNRHLRVNLTGGFYLARSAAVKMIEARKSGRIVFIGSWVGHAPDTAIIPYCVAKAGLRMLMKCMARELAPHDILVNEVAPGDVEAGVTAQVFREQPGRREASIANVPLGRLIATEEVAWQVANLCDPRNQNQTGSVVLIDGGFSLIQGKGR